jgi:hypothetical protein
MATPLKVVTELMFIAIQYLFAPAYLYYRDVGHMIIGTARTGRHGLAYGLPSPAWRRAAGLRHAGRS